MIALVLAFACTVQHHVPRARSSVHAFMRENPCPGGQDKGKTNRCRGYRVDHRIPLCAGGRDAPDNMSWQNAKDAAEKDKIEVALCRWIFKECGVPWNRASSKEGR